MKMTIRQWLSWSTWSDIIDKLPTTMQFTILVIGVCIFFGLHNLLQEAIMVQMMQTQQIQQQQGQQNQNQDQDHQFGIMLGYTEVLGVAIGAYIERHHIVCERNRTAPLAAFTLLTCCLLTSSALSNISLNYINFPTKVVFRSSKLIPTMLIATFMHHARFSSLEYICALSVCTGLILFAAADWTLRPSFHPIGLLLVTTSVVADAFLPNAQERLFRFGSSRLEVTLYTNIFSIIAYTISTLISGDLFGCIALCRMNSLLTLYFIIYTFVAYIAISFHMTVVKRFGGVAAVVVATGRKGLTLILSFVLFPKAFSWFYPAGATLVLGGILVASLFKMNKKKIKNQQQQQQQRHLSSNKNDDDEHQNGTITTSNSSNLELHDDDSSFDAVTPLTTSPVEADVSQRKRNNTRARPMKSHMSDIETPPPSSTMMMGNINSNSSMGNQ